MLTDDRVVVVEKTAEGSYLACALKESIHTAASNVEVLRPKGLEIWQFRLCAQNARDNSGRYIHSLITPRDTLSRFCSNAALQGKE